MSNTCPIWTSYGLNERYWSTEKDAEIRLKKYEELAEIFKKFGFSIGGHLQFFAISYKQVHFWGGEQSCDMILGGCSLATSFGGAVSQHHSGDAVSQHHFKGGCSLMTSFLGVQSHNIILGVVHSHDIILGGMQSCDIIFGGSSLVTSFWGGGCSLMTSFLGGGAVSQHHFGGPVS